VAAATGSFLLSLREVAALADESRFSFSYSPPQACFALNISERTFARVRDFVAVEPRGRTKTKEGQDIETYFVGGVPEGLLMDRRKHNAQPGQKL
jgi:hypothetical protein